MAEHVNTIFFEINTRKLEIDRITQRFDTSFDLIKTNSHFILEKEREYLKSSLFLKIGHVSILVPRPR